jgi:uncharacterized protein (TIGR03118 family)
MNRFAIHRRLVQAKVSSLQPKFYEETALWGRRRQYSWLSVVAVAGLLAALAGGAQTAAAQTAGIYAETSVISDGAVPATTISKNFVDPWGVAGGNTLWINTNVTGLSYVTSVVGVLNTSIGQAVVPPAVQGSGAGSPTGIVQNTATTGFVLSNGTKASFLFATGDGTISGWNSAAETTNNNVALIEVNNSANNAVYNGMAMITNSSGSYLLVSNFGQGADVEVYNSSFQPATLQGKFADPNVPTGYAPYNVVAVGTQVFVTYMLRTTPPFAPGAGTYQEIFGKGNGFVSVFDDNGNFITRAVGIGNNLDAPWGVTIAPASFGIYGGDLLIGNFADGLITAYNPTTYAYLGVVADGTGKPIAFPGLWSVFVSTATGNVPNSIYFTAGLDGETHGLFGYITNMPTTTGTQTFNVSTSTAVATLGQGATTNVTFSIAPSNGFAGMVNLSCSGLPLGATCSFSPAQIAVSANAPATGMLTIQTSAGTAGYDAAKLAGIGGRGALGAVAALLLLTGTMMTTRRRRWLRWTSALGVLLLTIGLVSGCSYGSAGTPSTPEGTSNVTVTATSGSVTQTSVIAMTVN